MTTPHITMNIAAIAAVAPAMGNKDVRYYLNGVKLERTSDGVRAIATDGHHLMVARDTAPMSWDTDGVAFPCGNILIPRDAVLEMLKLAKGDTTVTFEFQPENAVKITLAGRTFGAVLIDGRYPEWQAIVADNLTDTDEAVFNVDLIESFVKSAKALRKVGAANKFAGMMLASNGREQCALVHLHGTAENLQVGGAVMPLRRMNIRDRDGFLSHLKAA